MPKVGAEAERSYSASEFRGGGQEELPYTRGWGGRLEEQPHDQGAVAGRVQEGLEELLHIQGQKGLWWGDNPRPR